MTIDDQIIFLTNLGKRLDNFTSPGDAEDYLTPNRPLWTELDVRDVPAPARVIDILLRRWIVIKDFKTLKPVNMSPNPAQLHFSRTRQQDEVVLKAGRAGFTTMELMCALLKCATTIGYTAVLVGHDQKSVKGFFTQVLFAYEHLAGDLGSDLRAGALRTQGAGGKKNAGEIYFPVLNSHFFIDTAGNFAPAEGTSIQYLIADEMARWVKGEPKQVIATLLSHVTGGNTKATLMSRPFGQHGEFYERYWSARRGDKSETDDRAFGSHFYQWWWNPAQRTGDNAAFKLTAEEERLVERYKRWRHDEAPADCGLPDHLNYSQLRWRRTMRNKLKDLFPQEFSEDEAGCFLGSGNCPFDAVAIDIVQHDVTPVLERKGGKGHKGETENGLLRWRDPVPDHTYILFIDPAGTLFTSRVAMCLLDATTGEQVAEWVGRGDAKTIATIAFEEAVKFGNTTIVFESNMGEVSATVAAKLTELGLRTDGYLRIENGEEIYEPWPALFEHQDSGGQWQLGWKTDSKNRPQMLSDFGDIWQAHPEWFHSRRLANEVKTCVRNGDRIEPGKGMTDDLVMATAGAHAVRPLISGKPPEPMVEFLPLREGSNDERSHLERTFRTQRG